MNKIYKVIWNAQLGCWQAVSELAKNHRPSQSTVTDQNKTMGIVEKVSALILFGLALLPLSVQAAISNIELPTGAQINSGSAKISQNGHTLNINQSSQTLSTNWNSFNIGQDATVNFNQQNQSSIAINRVLDSNASQIMGRLNANGQVFLLNPNGVVFSKTAQVNVGGLVASTLALTDHDIQNGQFTLKGDANSHASIENYGAIQTSQGGTVALIAPNVKNTGSITTPNGTTHLTSASQVTLALQDGSLTQYQVDQGVFKGLVDNGGAILADNGAVYLTAKAKDSLSKAVVNHSGIIEANRLSQNAKGEIILLGDMQTGTTTVSGVLKAEGKNSQDGGFIETSAAKVKIENSTVVSTRSAGGKTGNWLIDPIDFNINAGNAAQASSGMGATTLANNLANNNVTVQSSTGGSQKGDINVNAEVKWDSANSLTLNAHNDININANVTSTHNKGKLNLIYGQDTANSNANYKLNKGAKINLRAGDNFSSKKGTDATVEYKVITALGKQDSTTGADLQGINGNLNGNYVLGADIDATESKDWNAGQGFNPIGDLNNPFKGKLDGLGHTISKLYINRPTQDNIGLIGYAEQAQIRNIGLLESNITGKYYVGGLVGLNSNNGSINNVYATGSVSGKSSVGGLVGWNSDSSSINNTYAMGTVSGQNYVGGLVGFNNGSINNAYAMGTVSGNDYVGGLVGWNSGVSSVNNAYAMGTVSGQDYVGGLVGANGGSINNAYATGSVSGRDYVGGLVGWNSGSINNAYATASVSGKSSVGGLVGLNNSGSINNAYWNIESTGQMTSAGGKGLTTAEMFQKNNMKGFDFNTVWGNANDQTTPYLLGLNDNQVFNKNDLPVGPITATNRPALYSAIQNIQQLQNMQSNLAGSFAVVNNIDATESKDWNAGQGFNPIGDLNNPFKGKLDGLGHTISKLYINRPTQNYIGLIGYAGQAQIRNIGLLESNITGKYYVGGLVGLNSGSINNAYATGSVSGKERVGGLVGANGGSINNAYATGSVSGNNSVGSLVGWNSSSINNAYATGSVSGKDSVGGLVGSNQGNLRQVYATGQVTGTTKTGGLIGYHASGTVENAYWNTETTGQNSSWNGGNGVNCNTNNYCGLTTAEMFQKNNMKGFDFNTVWGNANDQTTPYLLGLNDNQVFNKNDLPVGPITATNRPALYSAIQNIQQLQNMQSNLAGSFAVVNNIDATESKDWNAGQGFNPIGDLNNPFKGKLDGLGHTISKLYINRPTQNNIGLIGYAGQAQIRNIGLLESNIRGNNSVGGLVGWSSGVNSVNNAYAMGTVSGRSYVGGLVGWSSNSGSINNAYAMGTVSGQDYVGGLVGWNSGSINNAYATASVSGQDYVGGLVGWNSGSINNAYATASVSGWDYVGGLVGWNSNSGSINNAYAMGTVSGQDYVGGLVGWNSGSINNAYATASVSGWDYVGGLVGWNSGSIHNAYATASVSGKVRIGGLVGSNQGNLRQVYATGQVTGTTQTGGLIGYHASGTVENAYWNTETTGQNSSGNGGNGVNCNTNNYCGLTTAEMFQKNNMKGFDFNTVWGNANDQTTPYLLGLNDNQVFNKNDLPVGPITATNRPVLYSAIQNIQQLQNMQSNLVGNYAVVNNIDATESKDWNAGQGFNPIGDLNNPFKGKLDGLGHTISKLYINRPTQNNIGLIGYADQAQIRNIGLLESNIRGNNYVGGLVGFNSGSSINNAYAMGTVSGNVYVGGLVGWNSGSINNAYAMGTVSGQDYVGGLVGFNGGSINNAYAIGSVSGNAYVGGLVGWNSGSINNAYATGSVSGKDRRVGGLVGTNEGNLRQVYATGQVTGKTQTGGLIGYHASGTVENAYWNTETTGQNSSWNGGNGVNCNTNNYCGLTTAEMFQKNNMKGFDFNTVWGNANDQTTPYLLGLSDNQAFNKNDLPVGPITATNRPVLYSAIQNIQQLQNMQNNLAGNYAVVNNIDATESKDWNAGQGFNPIGDLNNQFNGKLDGLGHTISKLYINRPTQYAIGLIGYAGQTQIRNIGLLESNIRGNNYVGGLVGWNSNSGSINNAYAMGTVSGNAYVGGLVGWNSGSINNAYATGSVSGKSSVGGLVGLNGGSINNAYATGSVSGKSSVGGLVGLNGGSINNAYWDIESTGQMTSAGGTGLTSAGMKDGKRFAFIDADSYLGGENTVWWMYQGDTAPLLRSFLTPLDLNTLDVTTTYNGKNQSLADVIGLDPNKIFGGASGGYRNAGDHSARYYSHQQGYDLIGVNNTASDAVLKINKAKATVTANSLNTVYNGKDQTAAGFTVSGLVNGETESVLSGVSATVTGKDAGKYTNTATGIDKNYELSFIDGSLDIAKAKATVTANSISTTYNGKDQTAAGFSASGLVNGETESVLSGVSATVTAKDAGSYTNKANGVDKNYDLTFVDGALDIAKAKATITANSLNTVYNGQNQTATGFSATGLVNGEDSSVLTGVTASVTAKDAGSYTNKANGIDKNYDLTFVDGALDIAKAKATVTANSVSTVYNGQNQTASGFSATGLVNGETESVLSGVTASVTAKDAGSYTNKANGVDKNYDLSFVDGALDIAKAKATVTANSLNTTYNGKNQTASGFSATGLVNGEDSSVLTGVTASVTAKDAGSYTNKANGVDKNYDLTFVDGALDIAKAKATVTANSVSTVYNGQNQTASGFSATGLVNGETESVLSDVTASVTAKDAGSYTNKANGVDKNYDLTFVDGALDIAKAKATVTANSVSTVYNGKNQTASGFSATGLVNGETESVLSGVTASITAKDAGSYTNKANGVDKNYDLTFVDGALDIAKAKATVTANSVSTVYNGKNQTASGFSATGLVNGETESVLSGVTASVTAKDAGSYTNKANGVDKNYDLTFVDGALDIAKAKINQVTGITANNRIYDATTNATLNTGSAQFTGMVAGDELKVASATGQFSDKNVGIAKQVSIQGVSLSGADAHNYELVNNTAQTTADIRQANIQNIAGITANNRTYNGLTAAELNLSNAQFNGIYAGDNLNVATATGQFDSATTGQAKNVSITGLSLGGLDAQNYKLVDTTTVTTADIYLLTPAAYLQAIQFKRPRYLPETNNVLNTVDLDVRQGGVNTAGIQVLAGEH